MKKVARRSAALALFLSLASLASFAFAQQYVVKPITEKKIAQLPPGQLVWRIETLPTLEQAKAAEGPTSLVAQVDGKTWLFTLVA